MSSHWGYHAMYDCAACDIDKITNAENIKKFVKELVERIDMTAYGEPIVVHFAEHAPEKAGYSLIQLIETSNISGHFCDINGDAYIDIFSCKEYDVDDALEVINSYFNPKSVKKHFVYRDAGPELETLIGEEVKDAGC